MANDDVLERISAWEAGGLIDGETAARLRAAESGRLAAVAPLPPGVFGPTPTVAEVLGYVGVAFVLAAWFVLMAAQTGHPDDSSSRWAISFGIAAAVTTGLGMVFRGRNERGSRAAGVLFATGVATGYGTGFNLGGAIFLPEDPMQYLIGGAVALALAVALRARHPGLLTQAAFLGAILAMAMGVGAVGKGRLFPGGFGESLGEMGVDLVVWLTAAVVLGIVGLRESAGTGEAAARRSALSRFAAGLTTIVATSAILTRSGPTGTLDEGGNADWGRLLEPAVSEAAIAVVALILLGLALRRGAPAYLYPAALGIVIALTDVNGSYVVDQVGIGFALLLEGVVILAAGVAADRFRRRLAGSDRRAEQHLAA